MAGYTFRCAEGDFIRTIQHALYPQISYRINLAYCVQLPVTEEDLGLDDLSCDLVNFES